MSNHGKKEKCVPKRRAHAYFIKPTAQAEINTRRSSSKNGASHFLICTQEGYTRTQQLDTKAKIKISYIHTHTTSWHCPVELSYWVNMASQTTSINRHRANNAKTWWWIEIQHHKEEERVKLLSFLSKQCVPWHIRENSISQGDDDSTDHTPNWKKKNMFWVSGRKG